MPGTCRTTFSRRIVLFLLILLAAPVAARSDSLENSTGDLAARIAENLNARAIVDLQVRNASTLSPADVSRIAKSLRSALQAQGVQISTGNASPTVRVTLSENLRGLIWTAEITQGQNSRVVVLAVARPEQSSSPSSAMPVALRATRFWEASDRILDALTVPAPGGGQRLLLLYPSGLVIRKGSGEFIAKLEVASAQTGTREPEGNFTENESTIVFSLAPRTCTVNLAESALGECHQIRGKVSPAPSLAGKGDPAAKLDSVCGGDLWLATGTGDDTQPDFVQAFTEGPSSLSAASNELKMPGPVLALHGVAGTPAAIAIVRNLRTGSYEAYRVSITCGS